MKRYHVYAIGNALVDMEFHVSDEDLITLGVDKGVMTLVDEARQSALFNALDHRGGKRASGGSAANTLIAVSQLGGNAYYSCKVASDATGDFYAEDLRRAGVHTNLGATREHGVSGKCIVMVTPDAERTMNTYLGISERVSCADLDEAAIVDSQVAYLEGYLVTSPTGREAAIRMRDVAIAQGVRTALTFSDPNMVRFFREGLASMVGAGVDLLFCNHQEAMAWADTDDVQCAADALGRIAREYVITLGAEGALVFDGTTRHLIPAVPVHAIDTNGAGDMFAGAYLYAQTHGFSAAEAGRFAVRASSRVVTHFGPRLPADVTRGLLPVA